MKQTTDDIQACYDAVAEEYAKQFVDEIGKKPMDRDMLGRFASAVVGRGPVWDLGCGPGQTTAYLHQLGVSVCGVDISSRILDQGRRCHPGVEFRQGNMLDLAAADDSLAGIVAFYAIVHLSLPEVCRAFVEMKRVLRPGGLLLLTYHIGQETIHVEEFLGKQAPMDFVFFHTPDITESLRRAGFERIEATEREPYPDVEYQSRRAYVFAHKPGRSDA